MSGTLKVQYHCKVCHTTYRSKHTCFGRSHRRSGTPLTIRTRSPLVGPPPQDDHQVVPGRVDDATTSIEDRLQLRAETTRRLSIFLRLKGDVSGSKRVIMEFLSDLRNGMGKVLDLAALHLSQATNYAYCFDFTNAHAEAKKCRPSQDIEESTLLWDQILCVGRLMRGEGHFTEAMKCFSTCFQTPNLRASQRFLVMSAVADVGCELAYQQTNWCLGTAMGSLELEITMGSLELEINKIRRSSRSFRRLLLSLIELKIRQGYDDEACLLCEEALAIYSNLKEPDIVDRLGHVRTLIAFARISPTPVDAAARWKDVLDCNKFYNPSEEEVFTCGVVYLFLCITWHKLGNADQSMGFFGKADQVLQKQPRQFLIPGVGTYLFDNVCKEVSEITQVRRMVSYPRWLENGIGTFSAVYASSRTLIDRVRNQTQ